MSHEAMTQERIVIQYKLYVEINPMYAVQVYEAS